MVLCHYLSAIELRGAMYFIIYIINRENKGSFLLLMYSRFWRIPVIDVATQTRHTLKSVMLK